jgi:hypothetical protein
MPLPVTVGGKITAADINNIGNFPVSTFTALPSTGNWLGRQIAALDTGVTSRWNGSAWVLEDTGWITPTLGSGWSVTAGETPEYRRRNGVVFLRGRAARGSGSTPAFILPAGFRPSLQVVFMAEANGVPVRASIPSTGEVVQTLTSGAVAALSFGSMPTFIADL